MMDSKTQASDVLMSYHISPFGAEHEPRTSGVGDPTMRMMDANSESKQFEPE